MKSNETIIKIALAIVLFLCLLNMPYGFYQLVRFIALIGFGVLAYNAYNENNTNKMIVFGALALLFQPFFKIALGRAVWNILDVIIGIALIISLFVNTQKKQN